MRITGLFSITAFLALTSLALHAGDAKDMKAMTPPMPPPDEGFYMAAYGGAQFDTDYGNQRRNLALPTTGANANVNFVDTVSNWGGVGGIKAGYKFDPYLITDGFSLQPAVEGEALYIGGTSFGSARAGTFNGAFNEITSYNSTAWFVNGIVRFKLDFPLTPYIGVGAGGEYITTHTHLTSPTVAGEVSGLDGSDVDFAAQALFGLDYAFTSHWTVFSEYKFIDALGTDIKYSNAAGSGGDYRFKPDQIEQNLITAGVKYNF